MLCIKFVSYQLTFYAKADTKYELIVESANYIDSSWYFLFHPWLLILVDIFELMLICFSLDYIPSPFCYCTVAIFFFIKSFLAATPPPRPRSYSWIGRQNKVEKWRTENQAIFFKLKNVCFSFQTISLNQ